MSWKSLLLIGCLCLAPFYFVGGNGQEEIKCGASTEAAAKINVRMLMLKHSKEYNADNDAVQAIQAIKDGAKQGLSISSIGNHYYTKRVGFAGDRFTHICDIVDSRVRMNEFQAFVSEQMKVDSKPHDTLIVFTIGHGGQQGQLQNLGQRSEVMKALAGAAEENNQRTMWWQLSCYACAGLPKLDTLPTLQQDLFSMVASSVAEKQSYFGTQGKVMSKLFIALADKSNPIDLNQDGVITAGELNTFLNSPGIPRSSGGPVMFGSHDNAIVFGWNRIPIINWTGPQRDFPDDYIRMP